MALVCVPSLSLSLKEEHPVCHVLLYELKRLGWNGSVHMSSFCDPSVVSCVAEPSQSALDTWAS